MKKVVRFFLHPVVVSLIGLLLLSLLIWFAGPHIKFGAENTAPLASTTARLILIMIMTVVWGLNNLRVQWQTNKQNQGLVDEIEANQAHVREEQGDNQASAEIEQIRERFTQALATLKKLKFDGKGRKKALYELPWYIIVGPPGAGKTTALINSGLDFPLAEQFGKGALQGIGGTRNCDWWFTNDAVLVDTAGRYTTQDSHKVVDSSAWEGFLSLLKRNRRRRPINGAIVAISLQDILTQTEEERMLQAKIIRSRLDELMEKLEIRFPVYLMFTKVDLVSGFSAFFEDLNKDDREQVWGVSLPNAPKADQSPDFDFFDEQFNHLIRRLYDRVLWRVHQERDTVRRGDIAGFPQQMENLKHSIDSFVRQTFVKNRYKFQPFLRGVYFSSATQDGTPIDRLMSAVVANFGLSSELAQAQHQQGKSYFLNTLFRQVIFPESELVGSNVKYETFVRWAQRAAYIGIAGVTLSLILVWAGSVTRNKMYMNEVQSYVNEYEKESDRLRAWNKDIRSILPPLNALAKASVVYDQERHPWLSGLGLYDARVDNAAGRAYHANLNALLLPKLIENLEASLRQGHEGGDVYSTFRTYLMFNKLEHMDPDIVKAWFQSAWDEQFVGEASRRKELEQHLDNFLQLEFEPVELNPSLLSQTRSLLLRVPVSQRIYSRVRTNPRYTQKIDMLNYLGESVRNTFHIDQQVNAALNIPFLFTAEGYESIDLSPSSPVVVNIINERWVLSDDEEARVDFVEEDLDEISEKVKSHYLAEYTRVWEGVYQALEVKKLNNLQQVNDALARFTDPVYSPLLAILQTGRTNTQLSNPTLANLADDHTEGNRGRATSYLSDKFEGTVVDKRFRELNVLLRESNKRAAPVESIIQRIQTLQNFVEEIMIAPDPKKKSFEIAKARYQSGSGNAITALRNYAKSTPLPVRSWLENLADETWKALLIAAKGHVNAQWDSDIYQTYRHGLAQRYPLNRRSRDELALFDFNQFFKPGGKVDVFYGEYIKPFINTKGSSKGGWSNRSVDSYSMGFSKNTLNQVKKALTIKQVFFRVDPESPSLTLELKPKFMNESDARFSLEVGDNKISYNHGPKFWKTLVWSAGDKNKRVRLFFEELNGKTHSRSYDGPWAWFRMQDDASLRSTPKSNVFNITFYSDQDTRAGKSRRIVYELKAKSVVNPFNKKLLGEFRLPDSI